MKNVHKDGRVGGKDRCPVLANVVPNVEGDVGVSRLGNRSVMNVLDAHGVAVVKKPGQGRSGRRKANGADKDTPIIGCTAADIIRRAVKEDHC